MGKKNKKQKKSLVNNSKKSPAKQLEQQVEDLFYNTKWDKNKMLYKCVKKQLVGDHAIFEIKKMILQEEACKLIEIADSNGFEESFQRETRECAFRKNLRLQFFSDKLANILFDRIKMHLPIINEKIKPIGLSDNFRLYKYLPGHSFGPHIDESVTTTLGHETLFTLLMYLNDEGLEGGETSFYSSDSYVGQNMDIVLKYKPTLGNALVHMHGDDCLLHEGNEVKRGVKYLFRTDICYGMD
eukprot:g2219.t1